MANFTDTNLWKKSLSQSNSDDENNPQEKLRSAFLKFRERAGQIAGEINRDLPEYTVHDITHLDALWEMADLIAGEDFYITPTEAFVLGGGFLIHDLGNGLAAYPEGIDTLRSNQLWNDTVTALLKKKLGRYPTTEELQNPENEIEREAIGVVLRNLHAKHAERLALVSWKDREIDEEYHLIEDTDLRRTYGQVIGKIAHSHWWNVDRLASEFPAILGAPTGYPREWTVDPLKVACLLRTADASHLDTRRAPGFLRALRKPSDYSRQHWVFQEHLQQPRLESGRLVYSSGRAFPVEDANAWWICFDTLKMVDNELQQVDALLADTNRNRLVAKGVAGVDNPMRLFKWIPAENWLPVDTHIKVGNVASLVRSLGGEQLYGRDKLVPLRELIQNASDAIRARRLLETRPERFGDVYIRTGKDSNGHWVEVEDNGVGMSTNVLTGAFLDFGSSFWGTSSMLTEFPGLLAKGFESTGKYGIGFFSVFMWGNKVRVTTRSYKDAQRETQILEFRGGLGERPILQKAQEDEYMREGGTIIRVWLADDPFSYNGVFHSSDLEEEQTFEEICASLCPSIDVNIHIQREDEQSKLVVSANDWIELDGEEFLKRIGGYNDLMANYIRRHRQIGFKDTKIIDKEFSKILKLTGEYLTLIKDSSGAIVGRVCITPTYGISGFSLPGVVTVGGFRSSGLDGICGLLIGTSETAARNSGMPVIDKEILAQWATEQAEVMFNIYQEPEDLEGCAAIIRACHGYTGKLPIAFSKSKWLSADDLSAWTDVPDEIILVQDAAFSLKKKELGEFSLQPNVLAVKMGQPGILAVRYDDFYIDWLGDKDNCLGFHARTLEGAVIEAIAKAWNKPLEKVVETASFRSDDEEEKVKREIGTANGKPVVVTVDIIKKPL